jgi:hypothetical protein
MENTLTVNGWTAKVTPMGAWLVYDESGEEVTMAMTKQEAKEFMISATEG